MEAGHQHHHEMPTSGRELTSVALSATLHCLTGCAIGEVLGLAIGTAVGLSNLATIVLAVVLAFLFGYGLTSLPLLRAGLALSAVVPIALASDTLSIATMEIVDNVLMVVIPGAMNAGLGTLLFWGSLSVALVIAGAVAVPVNRWLIARGKGHAVVHETGVHGGPPVRVVAAVAAVAAVFGTFVLAAEAMDSTASPGQHAPMGSHGGMGGHDGGMADEEDGGDHGGMAGHSARAQDSVRGLAASANGVTLTMTRTELPRGRRSELSFRIVDSNGRPVRDFEVEHEKRLHLIVVRRDLTAFQHLHPALGADGRWRTPLTLAEAGRYRVFADFKRGGRNTTLGKDLRVPGKVNPKPLPAAATAARTRDGYGVRLDANPSSPGTEAELRFTIRRAGMPVMAEPYLGARGHLVALRRGDLAYLHVHPAEGGQAASGDAGDGPVVFETTFPTGGDYRLFLQFKHAGRVHTAAFTRAVRR